MPEATAMALKPLQPVIKKEDEKLYREIKNRLVTEFDEAADSLEWLHNHMHPYFFITMQEETETIIHMAHALHAVANQRRVTLWDTDKKIIIVRLDEPGSIYETMKTLQEADISYAEMGHSYAHLPGCNRELEVLKYEFERKSRKQIAEISLINTPSGISRKILEMVKRSHSDFNLEEFDELLRLIWINNEKYVKISPPDRTARIIWLFQQCRKNEGLFIDVEATEAPPIYRESRLYFSLKNPNPKGFMPQISEIFQRLNIGVRRSYSLNVSTSMDTYFLGTFYIRSRSGDLVEKTSTIFHRLKSELYNTQILPTSNNIYKNFVINQFVTGEEASLANAFVAFVHTTLAHSHPDRFSLHTVTDAFDTAPQILLKLLKVFNIRFAPEINDTDNAYAESLEAIIEEIRGYNTGQEYWDEIRKKVFKTCLLFIQNCLKTNYFVPEKNALAFRLDPAYLLELGPEFTKNLPNAVPYRITFFFGRFGVAYHIGFSDISRGGWRSIICRNNDEYISNTNSLFKEIFVLAHTQHLKNKDIYEGGAKMGLVIDAVDLEDGDEISQRLHDIQYGMTNAFLDIFVTERGRVKHSGVVDYYRQDEPIELGPDENMHDGMIELIAQQAEKRGYLLGTGIMSSKQVGINHKEYGVTSRGVVKFVEIAMHEIGLNIRNDDFTARFTGGPNGDVAGNAMRLLLKRCPRIKILSMVDGTAGIYDPQGADKRGLSEIILKSDLEKFDFKKLHNGAYLIYKNQLKMEGVRPLYLKIERNDEGLQERWITRDELNREINFLTFSVATDLFLPCGGRPETINDKNWQTFFNKDNAPSARIIVEGANSFITPNARVAIQEKGVIVLRDASANKGGVISSSYEIIANLLMASREFMTHKEAYVRDVIHILEQRAADEANLIFERYRASGGKLLLTDISTCISEEINKHYEKLFDFFQNRPKLARKALFNKVILNHLPGIIRDSPEFCTRPQKMPEKIKCAILASEIASNIIYRNGWQEDFESKLTTYVKNKF